MKKNLLHIFMVTFCMMLMTITAQAQCYIIGSDGSWHTNVASAELQATGTEGVYEGVVAFSNGSQYFTVVTKLTENDNDWEGLSLYRYGPDFNDEMLTLNTPMTMYAKKDASFMMPAADGTYRIRVDFNTNKITILGNFPKQVYLIGSNGEFKPNEASETIAMSETEGVYKATVNFENLYFSVLTQLGTTEDDWTGIEPYRYGGGAAKINRTNRLNRTEQTFTIPEKGSYDVTIDLRNMTILLYNATYVPEYPDAIYLHGLDGNIAADKGEAIEWSEVEGVYTGWVNFCSKQFNISTALASTPDGWEEISDKRIGTATATCDVETNLTVNLKKGEWTNFFVDASEEKSLYVYMTLDLRNNRMTFYGNDENYPTGYPKELYLLGTDNAWLFKIPTGVLSATDEGKYEGDITFTTDNGQFAILQRLGMNWDFVNAKRLNPNFDGALANLNEDISFFTTGDAGAWTFQGSAGTYAISVDLKSNVIRITEKVPSSITSPMATPIAKSYFYDLNGRYLGTKAPQKGIVVVKGKKIAF